MLNERENVDINNDETIPGIAYIEKELPIEEISELAKKEGNSKKPVYEIHKWWARRLSAVVRAMLIGSLLSSDTSEEQFWENFYSNNSGKYSDITIMDIFMGGGTSLVEAKKMGANTIGVDIDPLACFITKKELEKYNYKQIEEEFKKLEGTVGKRVREFYLTEVDGIKYPIINLFWVYEVTCDECGYSFETHPHYQLYHNNKEQYVFCKKCGKVEKINVDQKTFICKSCNDETSVHEGTYNKGYCLCPKCNNKFKLVGNINGINSTKMFALEYVKDNKRFFKETSDSDRLLFKKVCNELHENLCSLPIPKAPIPTENRVDMRPVVYGYEHYSEMFNNRQLLSLALILKEILRIKEKSIREWFIISFSDCLASNNMLCNYAYGYRKLTPLFGIHAYTVPVRPVENNVWGSGSYGRGTFERTVKKMIRSKKYCENVYENKINEEGKVIKIETNERISSIVTMKPENFYNKEADSLILNQSSECLNDIRDKSVDIILTDPPYYDNLNYSELADFYYQWIKDYINANDTEPIQNSLFVNVSQNEYHQNYQVRLTNVFNECYKKLKDNGIMVFSYHHNKEDAWTALGEAVKSSNFIVTNVLPIRSEGSSGYHTSEKSIKWDSILILRKANFGFNTTGMNRKMSSLISYWDKYIGTEELGMKACDKLSFYRSLAVMVYSNIEYKNEITELYSLINET